MLRLKIGFSPPIVFIKKLLSKSLNYVHEEQFAVQTGDITLLWMNRELKNNRSWLLG